MDPYPFKRSFIAKNVRFGDFEVAKNVIFDVLEVAKNVRFD